MTKPGRIDTSGQGNPLLHHPFDRVEVAGLKTAAVAGPSAPGPPESARSVRKEPNRNRGRVDVIRQKAGRGGKTVTVLTGFKGIATRELEEIAREIRKAAGVGGTLKDGAIEIQGDQRDRACVVLEAAGFRPVRAGG